MSDSMGCVIEFFNADSKGGISKVGPVIPMDSRRCEMMSWQGCQKQLVYYGWQG